MIAVTRAGTDRAFNVNLFVHATPRVDKAREQGWSNALRPLFESFCAEPPSTLRAIYKSFTDDEEMLAMLATQTGASFRRRGGCVLSAG